MPRHFGSLTSEIFTHYLQHSLLPHMQPGQKLVMDNSSVHKTAAVQQALVDFGMQPLYLPPYWPEYNPIELAWSKIKTVLRKIAARMFEALLDAMAQAITSVNSSEVNNWITHCGYVLNS